MSSECLKDFHEPHPGPTVRPQCVELGKNSEAHLRNKSKPLTPLILALIVFMEMPALGAVRKTWNGWDGAWSDPAAWSPVGVPSAEDEIEIGAGAVTLDLPVTISNLLVWKGGLLHSGTLRVGPNAVVQVTGDDAKTLNSAILASAGRMEIDGGGSLSLFVNGHGQTVWITNELGGVVECTGTAGITQINPGYSASVGLVNEGLFRKSDTNVNYLISTPLYNRGIVEVQAGLFRQSGGGSSPGRFRIAADAVMEMESATYDLAGSVWEGPGPARLIGDATLYGTFVATNFVVAGGHISGEFDVSGAFRWTGGWLTSAQGRLGAGRHRIEGVADKALNHATLANAGELVAEDTAVGFTVTGNGQRLFLTNEAAGVFELRGAVTLEQRNSGYPATLGIDNDGLLRSSSGVATNSIVSIPLNNRGGLEAQGGVLRQTGGGESSGQFVVAEGARFEIEGGTYGFGGSRWYGPGPGMVVNSATLNGVFNAENFVLANGYLSGVFEISGGFHWTGGWLSSAQVRLGPGSHRIDGPADKALNHATLTNTGVLGLGGAALGLTVTGNGQTCVLANEPAGRLDLAGDCVIEQRNPGYAAVLELHNGGQLRKLGGGVSAVVSLPLSSAGRCEVQEGLLQLESLTLDSLAEVIVPVSSNAPLRVVGAAALAGALQARVPPGQVVTNAARFEAIRAGSITGSFANTLAINPGHLFGYVLGYTPQSVTLTAQAVAENPVALASVNIQNGRFTITLNGAADLIYLIEVSTNLARWETLLLTNAPAGTVSLQDPHLALDPQRYYRLVLFP